MSTPRRVLQVISPSHLSGAEMQLVRLRRQMEARGHEMPVVVKAGSSVADDYEGMGVPVDRRRIGGKVNLLAVRELAAAARRARADLLHTHLSSASWWAGWLERFGGPPTLGHVHGFTSGAWHRGQSHLVAVSNAIKQHLVEQGIPGERITVLYNALDPSEFQPKRSPAEVRAEFGADADTPVVGTFGHLSVKKGYHELLAAMPTVLKRRPDTQFWIVGQGKLRDELQATAERGGFASSVRFAGFRRDAADLMNAIDVMALPSHREPCALVYIEAALSSKPIVACRAGGAVESVADGQTGLLVPVKNAPAVAEAILTLVEDRAVAQSLGAAGRERALDIFSWDRYVRTLEGVYDRMLDESTVTRAA